MTGILMASVGNSYGSAPVNTVAPAVTGTATFGQTLTTTNGTWTGAPAPTFTYQWFRSPSTSISGATSTTYVLVQADVGFGIYCQITATNSVAPSGVTANSNTTATVAALVPGAPTIGTATATGSSTATVAYTAPASNGGATITTYTATSSPGGITGTLSQAGSGTITVSGLTGSTSYTFTVTATNSVGTSAASGSSNSITTSLTPSSQSYTTSGTYTWVAPTGVTSVSAVAVGGGKGAGRVVNNGCGCYGGTSGAGGSLSYKNNYSVTPGSSYTVVVAAVGVGSTSICATFDGFNSSFVCASSVLNALGGNRSGSNVGTASYLGGAGQLSTGRAPGGGGAGGYSGAGGIGAKNDCTGAAGTGGAGGGGASGAGSSCGGGGGGGGVGLNGQGSNGARGSNYGGGGGGGSGGSNGSNQSACKNGGAGGAYGGGGGVSLSSGIKGGDGAAGAVRIIWPGNTRSFPSTCAGAP